MASSPPTLSVIVPVFNEAPTLREVLRRVAESPVKKEILIVDDCSTDGTRAILQDLEKSNPPAPDTRWRFFYQDRNQGKGAAIRRAQKETSGQVTIIQDADLELDPREYPLIIGPILNGTADVVYGSRFLGNTHVSTRWHIGGNQLLTGLSNLFTGLHLTDMETCYKAFQTELFQSLPLRANRFEIEPEITARIAKRRVRVVEVPISYKERTYTEGKKIGLKDAFQAVFTIVKCGLFDDI